MSKIAEKTQKSNKYIHNIQYKDNTRMTFSINNVSTTIHPAFTNAIRRILIANLEMYAIDGDKITFFENTSSIKNNEYLKERLRLIPINNDNPDIDYEKLKISCEISNTEDHTISIYTKNFVCKIDDDVLDTNLFFPEPYSELIFSKLKPNQHIHFEAELYKACSERGGAFYSPVEVPVCTFDVDEKLAKEIYDSIDDENEDDKLRFCAERIYQRNRIGEPLLYNFRIDSIGMYPVKKLLDMSFVLLRNKLITIKNDLHKKKSDKVKVYHNKENPEYTVFDINYENETIGELLQRYMITRLLKLDESTKKSKDSDENSDADVNDKEEKDNGSKAGYIIEHPLQSNLLLKIKLKENNTIDNCIIHLSEEIDNIVEIIQQIESELK